MPANRATIINPRAKHKTRFGFGVNRRTTNKSSPRHKYFVVDLTHSVDNRFVEKTRMRGSFFRLCEQSPAYYRDMRIRDANPFVNDKQIMFSLLLSSV